MIGAGRVRSPPPQMTGVKGGRVLQVGLGQEIPTNHNGLQIGLRQLG